MNPVNRYNFFRNVGICLFILALLPCIGEAANVHYVGATDNDQFIVGKLDLDVDSNNDLVIDENDEVIEENEPFIFWVNKDRVWDNLFANDLDKIKNLENFATLVMHISTMQPICKRLNNPIFTS